MKGKNKKIDFNKVLIIVIILLLVILAIICIKSSNKKNNSKCSETNEFEKIATYNYLENNFFNVNQLYILASNNTDDEVKIYQYQIKYVLDEYFNSHTTESSVSEDSVRNLLKEKFGTSENEIDFHGIIASGYIYNDTELNFSKDTSNEENIDYEYEELIASHSDDQVFIEKIEKVSDDSYTIYLDIIDNKDESITRKNYKEKAEVAAKATVKMKIDNDDLKIESCTIE